MESSPLSGGNKKVTPNLTDRLFLFVRRLPPSDRFLLKTSILAFFMFAVWGAVSVSQSSQVEVSSSGGTLREGVVGTPRFVNPVLAVTRADRDMSELVYDGLMKPGSEGSLVPNVAESVTISNDGLVYNVVLKNNVTFHDGTPLTAADVAFTVSKIQDPALTSPLRPNFEAVSVEEIDTYELNFVLPEPYVPFIENLTFGILPQHIWKDATNEEFPFSQHNSEPIGSGPYKVEKIVRNTSGIPERYVLEPHENYHNGETKISQVELHFFPNETSMIKAFNERRIDSLTALDHTHLADLSFTEKTHTVQKISLPRTFALFFNQNKSAVLRDSGVRKALNAVVDREALIESVLGGYGSPLHSPIPPGFGIETASTSATSTEAAFETAEEILLDAGWERNEETGIWEKEIDDQLTELSFSISTANTPRFEKTAEFLRNEWEKLGASVTIKQFEQSDLTQAIIRPRDYEALLFGAVVGRQLDFYSFWHSSQRNDPGLNVALYANITTDSILSKARTNQNREERQSALQRFAAELKNEIPAIFLYSPEMLYVFPKSITGESFTGLAEPHERFASITNWFINSEGIWPIFNKQ